MASYADAMLRPLLLTVALTASLAAVPATSVASPAGDYARSAVKATNAARAEHDRRPLRVVDCLQGFARKQAVAESQRAMEALSAIPHSSYRDSLLQLAAFAVSRTY